MGKYGAYELNYSSDIDLIVFYDAERFPFRTKGDMRTAAVEIVKGLVKLLSEITADGYVFRTDLRLRPDAGATQVAISTEAAEGYYEGMGQNWERAAMIKARACAGDPQTGAAFLKAIEPFIWRRNLDYAAIEDIHSIKRQIHAHAGPWHDRRRRPQHQARAAAASARSSSSRRPSSSSWAAAIPSCVRAPRSTPSRPCARAGWSPTRPRPISARAYDFLRTLEHRLQMIEDQQTHVLPKSAEGLAHIACFMGYADVESFSAALRTRTRDRAGPLCAAVRKRAAARRHGAAASSSPASTTIPRRSKR